jgi:nitroreductase
MSTDRLSTPIGDVIFTQRSVRKFKPDPIPVEDLRLLLEAAVKAPNGANEQIGRFLVVTDRERIREFGKLYHEAWWVKRWDDHQWTTPADIPPEEKNYRSAMGLAAEIKDVPCIIFAFTMGPGGASSVMPACQNLMLAAHALKIGSIPTTLHATVMDRFYTLFDIPKGMTFHFCIPLGYPAVTYGPSHRKPVSETTHWNRWTGAVPWA